MPIPRSHRRAPLMLVGPPSRSDDEAESSGRDRELLLRLRAGDKSAAAAFYTRVRPVIDAVLRRLLRPSDREYEDAAQMALHQLILSLDRFDPAGSLIAWTSVVTARVVYQLFRRRRLERRIFSDAECEPLADTLDAAATLSAREAIAAVRSELDQMNPDAAWTFLLHDVCGYDLREIAQITSASLEAAQSRLSRGRRTLHLRIRNNAALAAFLHESTESGR